jgi:pimeloyl-ACP methyl ester carboxylesterase
MFTLLTDLGNHNTSLSWFLSCSQHSIWLAHLDHSEKALYVSLIRHKTKQIIDQMTGNITENSVKKRGKILILLHGPFVTSEVWQYVKPLLEKWEDITMVVTPDWVGHEPGKNLLKDHPTDATKWKRLSQDYESVYLNSYVEQLTNLISQYHSNGDIYIVAHSTSGVVVQQMLSAVTDRQILDDIKGLIFVGAILTRNGASVMDYLQQDSFNSLLKAHMIQPDENCAFVTLDYTKLSPIFFNTCKDRSKVEKIIDSMVLEPFMPLKAKVENGLEKFMDFQSYFLLLNDNAVSTCLQQLIVTEQHESFANDSLKVIGINCDHMPMVSCPDLFVKELLKCLNYS